MSLNTVNEFQFLKGAIKRKLIVGVAAGVVGFQFLKGAIKRFLSLHTVEPQHRFQFLKGAIKSSGVISLGVTMNRFQFLKGAIKRTDQGISPLRYHYFNSLKVRLKVGNGVTTAVSTEISIP